MSNDEFRKRMRELGWDEDYIEECLQSKEEAENDGIITPLEIFLTAPVIND